MGFFSKAWKGIKTGVKSIGKSIKGAFKKFGKFMGEVGILGQMAMMFVLPLIGNAILGTAGSAATVAGFAGATVTAAAVPASGLLGGALGAVGVAAGKAAVWVGNKVAAAKSVFSNITQGVVETAGNFAKTATNKLANKIGMENVFSDAATNFFGSGSADSAFGRSFGADSRFQNLTGSKDFFKDIKETRLKAVADANFEAIEVPIPKTGLAGAGGGTFENINLDAGAAVDVSEEALGTSQTFGEGTIGELRGKDFTPTKTDSLLAKSQEPTFIENLAAVPGKIVDKFKAEAETFMDDPFAGGAERLNSGLQTAGMQALGLEDKPEYTYNTMRSFVPEFQVASSGEYGATPIMDARAFEQNVTNNSNPYGYTAFQYGQYMSQLGQTA